MASAILSVPLPFGLTSDSLLIMISLLQKDLNPLSSIRFRNTYFCPLSSMILVIVDTFANFFLKYGLSRPQNQKRNGREDDPQNRGKRIFTGKTS